MTRSRRLRPFTPGAEPGDRLDARTVGRDAVLGLIADRLDAAATTRNRPHTLVVGPRGSGKSHVIEVALHRLARSAHAERLAVVAIDEDAVGITRVDDLHRAVLRALGAAVPTDPDRLRGAVSTAVGDWVLVLVLHNLDRIFASLGLGGQRDFRSWVENSGQIMVLATSPQLFPGVRDHAKPWYNNFGVCHLDDLTVAEGRDLLERLAREYGDDALAEFIATDDGEARLKAVHALAGGSPRIWMILSECLTVEMLDDLVLAVEGLLEGLVPYYQQLLWDLSGNEQRLVRALAEGPHAAATVSELAAAADIEQRSVATTLGRLADMNWVVSEKPPTLDKRTTWYRLSEPMLRHHLQYRAAGRQPLPLIVELLRALHDQGWRERELAISPAGSEAERLLARSLADDPRTVDYAWASGNPGHLVVEARRWINGDDSDRRTVGAGVAVEAAVAAALSDGVVTPARGRGDARLRKTIETALQAAPGDLDESSRIGVVLDALAQAATGRDRDVLQLVATGWNAKRLGWAEAADRLPSIRLSADDPLSLDAAVLKGQWLVLVPERRVMGRELLLSAVPGLVAHRGLEHQDTMAAQSWAGMAAWMLNDYRAARQELAEVCDRQFTVLGDDDPEARVTLATLGDSTGESGDARGAVELFSRLISIESARVGPTGFETVAARIDRSHWRGENGDAMGACSELLEAIDALAAHTGHPHMRRIRNRARTYLQIYLYRAVRAMRGVPGIPLTDGNFPGELIQLVHEAVGGSAQARVRLPSELLDIVDELRNEEAPA